MLLRPSRDRCVPAHGQIFLRRIALSQIIRVRGPQVRTFFFCVEGIAHPRRGTAGPRGDGGINLATAVIGDLAGLQPSRAPAEAPRASWSCAIAQVRFSPASPRAAARLNHRKARTGLRDTPWPRRYMIPSTLCAFALPCFGLARNTLTAARSRRGYRRPCRLPRGPRRRPRPTRICAARSRRRLAAVLHAPSPAPRDSTDRFLTVRLSGSAAGDFAAGCRMGLDASGEIG